MLPFARGPTYSSLNITKLAQSRAEKMSKVLADVAELYQKGQIRSPQPQVRFSYSEIEQAVSKMQGWDSIGKAVLVPQEEEMVFVRLYPSPSPV
jgi:hypothetical protein